MTDFDNREQDPRIRQLPEEYGERISEVSYAWFSARHSIGMVSTLAEASAPVQKSESPQPKDETRPADTTPTPVPEDTEATVTSFDAYKRDQEMRERQARKDAENAREEAA